MISHSTLLGRSCGSVSLVYWSASVSVASRARACSFDVMFGSPFYSEFSSISQLRSVSKSDSAAPCFHRSHIVPKNQSSIMPIKKPKEESRTNKHRDENILSGDASTLRAKVSDALMQQAFGRFGTVVSAQHLMRNDLTPAGSLSYVEPYYLIFNLQERNNRP